MVSYLIVNYNTWSYTSSLANTLLGFCGINDEVIVVDNASVEKRDTELPEEVIFVQNNNNTGFAGGVNVGVAKANNEFVFLLNSDLIVADKMFIDKCLRVIDSTDTIASISPAIIYENDKIQYAGYTPINAFTGRNRSLEFGQNKDALLHLKSGETPSCHGAAMCLRKSVWEKLNGFEEAYFLYYEEFDFCTRAESIGYTNWVENDAFVVHKGSLSMEVNNTPKHYYLQRNRMWYLKRNKSVFSNCIALPYILLATIVKYGMPGNRKMKSSMLRGAWHGITKSLQK